MTIEAAWQWLAYATREPSIRSIVNIDDQEVLKLGELLGTSPLMNPNLIKPKAKPIKFICQCSCAEMVQTTYVTTPPRYKKGHQGRTASRAYYRRKRAKLEAVTRKNALLKGEHL